MKGASKSDSELTYKKIIAYIENSSKDDYCKVSTSRKYARHTDYSILASRCFFLNFVVYQSKFITSTSVELRTA